MATFVKGNPVANATGYELFEKTAAGAYNSLATGSEINFEVSAMGLAAGDHTFVVKAKADGYEDSDYSNEVVYAVEGETPLDILFVANSVWHNGAPYELNGRARSDGDAFALSKAVAADGVIMIFNICEADGTITTNRIMNKTGTFTDFDSTKKYHVTFFKGTIDPNDSSKTTQTGNITQEELDSGELIKLYA